MEVSSELQHRSSCDVCVIIPAFRAASYIDRAIQSVLDQSILPKEIVIVDDGSDDNTLQVLDKYRNLKGPPEIKILSQNNKGAGSARNLAINSAFANFVAFLDSDDEWLPEKLARSMSHIESGNLGLVAHNGWIMENNQPTKNDIATRFEKASNSLFHGIYRRGFLSTSSVIVERALINQVGGFDTSLAAGQDFDLWLKILSAQDIKFKVFDEYLTKYHVRRESITRQTDVRLACTIKIAERYVPALRQHGGSVILSLWFRLMAVHYEAIRAHISAGKYVSALKVILKIPSVITMETIKLVKI